MQEIAWNGNIIMFQSNFMLKIDLDKFKFLLINLNLFTINNLFSVMQVETKH